MPRTREPKDRRSARWATEKLGWLPAKVTYKLTIPGQPFPKNVDLWGFGDHLFLVPNPWRACWGEMNVVLVNSCGQEGTASHVETLRERLEEGWRWLDKHRDGRPPPNHPANLWLFDQAGGVIEVWHWRKLKIKRGGKARRWTLRRIVCAPCTDGHSVWVEEAEVEQA